MFSLPSPEIQLVCGTTLWAREVYIVDDACKFAFVTSDGRTHAQLLIKFKRTATSSDTGDGSVHSTFQYVLANS